MTDFDNSWQALLRPGAATNFFDFEGLQQMRLDPDDYSLVNAWWLAEISRLIYKSEGHRGEILEGEARRLFLKSVGLRESYFFNRWGTQCAFIESDDPNSSKFGVLVFRGTSDYRDVFSDLNTIPVKWPAGGLVHRGFMYALDEVWQEIEQLLSSLSFPVFYTGHSLGGALAVLAAAKKAPCALYHFGSPRVGNGDFVKTISGVRAYRVVNNRDIVTMVPPSLGPFEFRPVGSLLYITHDHRLMVEPTDEEVAADRRKRDPSLNDSANYRHWFDPPEFLADHAPINYVAHLERQLAQRAG